jgi:hypothetical protein
MADIKPIFDQPPETRPLPTPYQDVPYSPLGFGGGVGAGAQQLAQGLSEVYKKAKDSADTSAVIGAIGQARKALNEVILDPQQGYISTHGTDAVAQREKYVDKFNDSITAAASTLTNDDQKRAFAQHVQAIQEEGIRHVYSHEAVQQEDVERAAFAGTTDEARKSMQWAIDNPNDLKKQLDQLRTLATAEGIRRFGNSPAAIQAVVAPEMGKAAISTMEAALASQDPKMAQTAFDAVKPYFLSNHEHVYGNQVRALQTHVQIAAGARDVLKGGLDSVLLPGGSIALRPNAAKIDAGVANLSPDNPLRDQIAEEAQKRHNAFDKAWSQTVAQVYANALTSGTDKSGQFSIDRVPIGARTWLQQNASDKLIALRKEDARAQRADTADQRTASSEYLSTLSADLHDPQRWADYYSKMTAPQFLGLLSDEKSFPGGFTGADRRSAQRVFDQLQQQAGKLEEPIGRTVKNAIAEAFPDDPDTRKQFEATYFEPLRSAAQKYVTTERGAGRKVDSEAVDKFLQTKMAKVPSGSWYTPDKRQIEIDAAGAVGGTPSAASPAPPTVKTQADYDALPAGTKYIGPDGKPATKRGG